MDASRFNASGQTEAAIQFEIQKTFAAIVAAARTAISDKVVLVDAVTKERAVWRAEIRAVAVSLVAALRASAAGKQFEFTEVQRWRAEVALRLNPAGRSEDEAVRNLHPHDRDISAILNELWLDDRTPKPTHIDLACRLEIAIQHLLKQEWDVSKVEARTGDLKNSGR